MEDIKTEYLEDAKLPEEEDVTEEGLLVEVQEYFAEILDEEIPTEKIAYRLEQLLYNAVDDPQINLRNVKYKHLLDIMISRREVFQANTCAELVKAVVKLEFDRYWFRNIGKELESIH